MKKPTDQEIWDAWDALDAHDISLPRLFAMICDHFNHQIDDGDIAEAMSRHPDSKAISA